MLLAETPFLSNLTCSKSQNPHHWVQDGLLVQCKKANVIHQPVFIPMASNQTTLKAPFSVFRRLVGFLTNSNTNCSNTWFKPKVSVVKTYSFIHSLSVTTYPATGSQGGGAWNTLDRPPDSHSLFRPGACVPCVWVIWTLVDSWDTSLFTPEPLMCLQPSQILSPPCSYYITLLLAAL